MTTKNESEIITGAENALKSIQDWRNRGDREVSDLTDFFSQQSLLPPTKPDKLAKLIKEAQESGGETPLALHAVACLNFIGGGEKPQIASITGKSKRWKRFSGEELPSLIKLLAQNGVRSVVGFCVSDLADFIDDPGIQPENIGQNVTAMKKDLDGVNKELRLELGKFSPDIRTFTHSGVFNSGPLNTDFDELFNSPLIGHQDVIQLRKWLVENATTPETDPFLTHAPEDEAVWQIFTSGILYAADASSSLEVTRGIFPAEKISGTVMLNLFPDYKADAVIQRIFTDILIPKDEQPPVITPFANAGRWESKPVPSTDFGAVTSELPVGAGLSPQEIFNKIMRLNDNDFSGEKLFDRKVSVASELVARIFDREAADKCLADLNSVRLARLGHDKIDNLLVIKVEKPQSLSLVVSKALDVSISEAIRLIAGGAVRIDGKKITVSGEGDRRALASQIVFPANASVMSVGKQKAWRVEFKKGE
jgi:hypothetical protein